MAEQLALPIVPYAGADGANVGDGQREQQPQAIQRLHDGAERVRRARIGDVAPLRSVRHRQMLLDQPGDALGVGGVEPQAWAQSARDLRAGEGVIDAAPLGDVVQEGGDIKRRAMGDLRQKLGKQRMVLDQPAGLDLIEYADRAQQMLVDGVVMVHRILHHADDAAEIRDEPPQHARFVHVPQRRLGRAARGEDFQKQPIGRWVVA